MASVGPGRLMKSQHRRVGCDHHLSKAVGLWGAEAVLASATAPPLHLTVLLLLLVASLLLVSVWSSPKPAQNLHPFRCKVERQFFLLFLFAAAVFWPLFSWVTAFLKCRAPAEPPGTPRNRRTTPSSFIPERMGHFWIYGLLYHPSYQSCSNIPMSLTDCPGSIFHPFHQTAVSVLTSWR